MFSMDWLINLAKAALAVMIAVLAVYFGVKIAGKVSKIVVIIALIVLTLWLIFSGSSPIHEYMGFITDKLPFSCS